MSKTQDVPPPEGTRIRLLKCPECGKTEWDSRPASDHFWGKRCYCIAHGFKMTVEKTSIL